MYPRTTHTAWYRCRIKRRGEEKDIWLYFEVSSTRKERLKREARFKASLYLKRQVFEIEPAQKPSSPLPLGVVDGTQFYGDQMTFIAAETRE